MTNFTEGNPVSKHTLKKEYKSPIEFYFEHGKYYIQDRNIRQFGLVEMTPKECIYLAKRMMRKFPQEFIDWKRECQLDKRKFI